MNPWADRTAADMLDASARQWSGRTAIVDGDVRLSFQRLVELRDRTAGRLAALGIGSGSRVAILHPDSWSLIVIYYALLKSGAVVIPLNLAWQQAELTYGLEVSDAEFLFVGARHKGGDLRDRVRAIGLSEGRRSSATVLPRLQFVYGMSSDTEQPLVELISGADDQSDISAGARSEYGFVLFTSGSSGSPKPAMVRVSAMLGSAHYHTERLGLTGDDRFLNVLPLYHGGGIVTGMLACHLRGTPMYVFPEFDVRRMIDVALSERCTAMNVFDPVLRRLLAELDDRSAGIPFTKMGIAPGSYCSSLEARGVTQLVLQYAMTEASNMVTISEPSVRAEREARSNGFPLPGVEVKIRDVTARTDCPPGVPGEICFKGWNLFEGYYGLPNETASRFDADGFFRTGDYGFMDEEGRLFYRGRYSMMVKTGGENVSEVEVEDFLTANLDYVVGAAVVGGPDEEWGEVVVAFVEVAEGTEFDPARIREDCRGKIAGYKIPKKYIEVSGGKWPVTATGKIDKAELRMQAASTATATASLPTLLGGSQ